MPVNEAQIIRKLDWALLPACCLVIVVCYLDRCNVAYMQLQLQRPPPVGMSFGPALYGNASGLFYIGYSVFQIPSNLILVRACCLSPKGTCLRARAPVDGLHVHWPPRQASAWSTASANTSVPCGFLYRNVQPSTAGCSCPIAIPQPSIVYMHAVAL